MNLLLFSLHIANIDKNMEKREISGIVLGGDEIWFLAYADNIIFIEENKKALEVMMDCVAIFK